MGIPQTTYEELIIMGITSIEDLGEYDADLIKSVKEDFRKPTGTMVDPNDETRVGEGCQ
jgi:predicted RecB family nuclease